jgi:hypothetical protein
MTAALEVLVDPNRRIRCLYGIRSEPEGNEPAPQAWKAGLLSNDSTVQGWLNQTRFNSDRMLYCVLWSTGGRPDTPPPGPRAYLDHEETTQAFDIGEESDDESARERPNPRNFPRTKIGFVATIRCIRKRIIRQTRYYTIIRNKAIARFPDIDESAFEVNENEVAWLLNHNWLVEPPTAGSLVAHASVARGRIATSNNGEGANGVNRVNEVNEVNVVNEMNVVNEAWVANEGAGANEDPDCW